MATGKDKESGISPEIARLSSLLIKDPKSKMFIPLAEEYLKAGMADEAISTLEAGLQANPLYMSAKVLLGKAYLKKGETDKAKEQFEMVVKTIPDNILAHRKLGEIYKSQGRFEEAARSFKMVTLLNPKDDEAKALLKEMEDPHPEPVEAESGPEEQPAVYEIPEEAIETALLADPDADEALEEPPGRIDAESPAAFPDADEMSEAQEEPQINLYMAETFAVVNDSFDINDTVNDSVDDEDIPVAILDEEQAPPQDFLAEALAEDALEISEESAEEPAQGYAVSMPEGLEDIFGSVDTAAVHEEPASEEAGIYEISDDLSGFEMDGFKVEPPKIPAAPEPKEPFETETLAELYISQGFYDRAINIYRNLLVISPDNLELRQKLEDIYLLAGITSAKAVARSEREEPRPYEPVDFAAIVEEMPGVGWPEGPATAGDSEPVAENPPERPDENVSGYTPEADSDAIKRLEQFLDNIRRKASQ